MENIICKIEIGKLALDDDYTFYEDGRIHRFYDQSYWSQNLSEFIKAENISDAKKKKIMEKCPIENMKKIKDILSIKI